MRQLIAQKDVESTPIYAPKITNEGWTGQLSAGVEMILPVPTGANWALVSASDFFFVSESTVGLPSGAFSKTNSTQSQQGIDVSEVTQLHFIARNQTDISVAFYR